MPLIWTLATGPTLEKVIVGRVGCVAIAAGDVSRLVGFDTCNANKLIAEHTTTREMNDLIEFFRRGRSLKPMES
jgi:hypothetical protein